MLKEFREFVARGNMIDMAVGIIIGAAFGGVVASLVADIIMPPIGMLLGQIDFGDLYINLSGQEWPSLEAANAAGAPVIRYGIFLNTVLHFLIVALAVFLLVKAVNRMRRREDAIEEATEKPCPYCQTTIPAAAIRCPNCTSNLESIEEAAGATPTA